MQPKYRYDILQNTPQWLDIKRGKFSASSCDSLLMARTTAGYKKLIRKITEERVTGQQADGGWRGNPDTERGHKYESEAIQHYELNNFATVDRVGVVQLDDWTICSPDGLINDDGLIQIKAPLFSTQWDYIEKPKVPTNYYKQMQFELMCTGRAYNVFYSWHPYLKPILIKIIRDEEMIESIRLRKIEAIETVKYNINKLK